MIFEMTEKQYQLFLHVMQVMQTFYSNNFSSICKEIGDAYGVNDADIEKAYMIFTDFKVTAPVPTMQNAAGEIYQTALAAADIEAGNKETPYTKRIDMNESAWVKAAAILDAYSRILMGQFSIIYEVLDIADTSPWCPGSRSASGLYYVTGLVGDELDLVCQPVLFQLQLNKTAGHGGAVEAIDRCQRKRVRDWSAIKSAIKNGRYDRGKILSGSL